MERIPSPSLNLALRAKALVELNRRRAPHPLVDPDPVRWIENNFWIPETSDRRIHLADYQKAALREALALDSEGNFKYSVIIWSDIKKSAKSTITAAVALWRAFQVPWGQIILVANDLKQADSRVGYYLRRAVELNPALRERAKVIMYNVTTDRRTRIESVPIDPSGEAGSNADMIVFSELWGAHQVAQNRMWTEMTLSPTKFGKSFRWIETYAGFSGESTLLEQLYDSGVTHGQRLAWAEQFTPPLEAYANQTARMFCLWNTTPRLPWQTHDYYTQEEAILAPNEFLRVHRNQWVSSSDAFINPLWWEACLDKQPPALDKNQPVILAMDAAVSGDTFGVLMLSGRQGYKNNPEIAFDARYARGWRPPEGGTINFKEIEDEIRRLCQMFNVIELAADPYQLFDMGSRLTNELIANVYFFSQATERLVADKALQDLIRDRRIRHPGYQDLTDHVTGANSKTEGDKLRIIKRSPTIKIDLAVCLSMAASRAAFWNL